MQPLLTDVFAIRDAHDLDAAKQAIVAAIKRLGFDRIGMSVNKIDEAEYTENPDISNFDDSFLLEYRSRRMFECDFNLRKSLICRRPYWFDVDLISGDANEKRFADFLSSHGMKKGIAFLCPSSGAPLSGMLVATNASESQPPNILMNAAMIATAAIMKHQMLGLSPNLSADEGLHLRRLTGVQLDILRWASEGKSNRDIATIMGLSKAGVDYHVRATIKKFGVFTKTQAVAIFSREIGP